MRSRLPVTLTSIIDSITKDKDELISEYGEVSEKLEKFKEVIIRGTCDRIFIERLNENFMKNIFF